MEILVAINSLSSRRYILYDINCHLETPGKKILIY